VQNKILSSFKKKYPQISWGSLGSQMSFYNFKCKSYESKWDKKGFKSRKQKRVGKI